MSSIAGGMGPTWLLVQLAFAVAYVVGAQVNYKEIDERCAKETNVPNRDIENYKNFSLPETREGQCYGACVMKAVNMMNSRGKIVPSKAEELAARYVDDGNQLERIRTRVQRCASTANRERNWCITSFKFSSCLLENRATTRQNANFAITFTIPLSFSPPPISLTLFSFG
uniref:Odorant-binding protein 19 n=1 Tax=Yemma signatus TaxID=300820 RepID=A0A3G2GRV5_9HEMI|nr:odorant-binding protein 19 [Yemma signatus]